ncbi:alpha-glucan family phosphorylase [Desulfofundulus thermobenzoicus]|uniref:Alpha-glucan family phosphorylase n=1 Tax=Desulfofundulus thermobenzoicus TaxID=29376 RepID=A0A6N7IS34_9FIRM|nr:alpha-glucan family phosphorylase [Desulfofundulus thermobenzoicus]MQL52916.1 alpha-glucan family phosphorylase [Desulfofundulus thermobenzoicus]
MYFVRTVTVVPKLPDKIARLGELARNLWFSWHPPARELFRQINGPLWEEVRHNPVRFLLNVRQDELEKAARDSDYLDLYNQVMNELDNYLTAPAWFDREYPQHAGQVIAYFSAEFGVHESHPTYSGGLGLLAGDHCKSASDLGIPFVGVGLLYKSGYFTQRINREGWQEAHYPYLNFYEMPVKPITNPDGSELIVSVELPGRTVYLKVWQMKVGRVVIYYLDADLSRNNMQDRTLTGQLYGGDRDTRISQEIILGIGGVRALRALNIHPRAWHINEGHAAFLLLERLRELVQAGVPVDVAREAVRAGTIFTTHTPVPAGHDVFSAEMMEKYFGQWYEQLHMDRETFLGLGWDEEQRVFNMTLLAMRLSSFCNGVSKLHGEVTREMFRRFYPGIPLEEMPITSITNGVHHLSWLAPELQALFDRHLKNGWRNNICRPETWVNVAAIPPDELWAVHCQLKEKMIRIARDNLRGQRLCNQEPALRIREVERYLDPAALTIGFARRFATYKRANLLLRDRERLARLVSDPQRPLQIIFAGKAHPADRAGQELIKQIYELTNQEPFKGRIVFLENYDIALARTLLQGVDVWLNTPRRPLEASGTSGQKAAVNGVIHCSVLDGWWPEAYDGENGFAVGEIRAYPDEDIQDQDDACSLYALLEETIIPMYYDRDRRGVPRAWVELMKRSLQTIPPQFNTERMVKEYCRLFYVPAVERDIRFTGDNYTPARQLQEFKQRIAENWSRVAIISVKAGDAKSMGVGDPLHIEAVVQLGSLAPEEVAVEIVYGNTGDQSFLYSEVLDTSCLVRTARQQEQLRNISRMPMTPAERLPDGNHRYTGRLILPQGTLGYTVRVRPVHPDFAHIFELPLVAWAPAF